MSAPICCPECGSEISTDYISADASRRRFFAALRDVHDNLRDEDRQRWPNPEIMRKHALCAIGYCDAMTVPVGSKAAAIGVANAFRLKDAYCIASIKGDVVTVFTARSMARRALPKPEFQKVADRVFDYIHSITGIDANKAGQAA